VTEQDGVTFTVPYYSNIGNIMNSVEASRGHHAEIALVVSHGSVPNPGGYFCAGMDAAAGQISFDPSRVIVVAPWYLGMGADTKPTSTQLQWTAASHSPLSGDWRDGGDSDPAGGRPGDVSSYQVIDTVVKQLLLSGAFPKLRGVVLWGDSAGGQVLARYSLTTHLPLAVVNRLRIFPSNPSSFPYLDARRWSYTFTDDQCKLGELRVPDMNAIALCPNYDQWRYGIAGTQPPYVKAGLARGGAPRFPSVSVTFVQGSQDICNEDGTCGTEVCPSGGLDRSCAAMLQGPMRLWRGRQYKAALDAYYSNPTHRVLELSEVGHDAYQVARAPGFLEAAFSDWPAAAALHAGNTTR
jgi:hypothetical protein